MSLTLTKPPQQTAADRPPRQRGNPATTRRNWLGGLAGWLWLAIIVIPIYWVLITSFKLQANYYTSNPMVPPSDPTLENYLFVLESGFVTYFVNSVVATAGAVIPAVVCSFMAAYAIVRGWRLRFLRVVNGLFLMGLAIPLQATVIPIYLIIIRLHLYD
ncbi:MAG: carbohydrate ABC transporter permease, partial [Actinomycetota bacterium]|nr:carbohydrate ABC transporter permease [Actinomycetota bacterium]